MGRIRQPYLDQIHSFVKKLTATFPLDIEITDTKGGFLASGVFHEDGSITVCANPIRDVEAKRYDSPSAMRHNVVASNRATYKYIKYNGKTFRELGVTR